MSASRDSELSRMKTGKLLTVYYNWRGRFISPVPRRVHLSPELVASAGYAEHQVVVDVLAHRIESGLDVTPQLSRDVSIPHESVAPRRSRKRRPDLDGLLAEWGITHLHLSLEIERRQPYETAYRTKNLLFLAVQPKDAYFISVLPHSSWTAPALRDTVVRNWPAAGIFHASRTKKGLTQEVDEASHKELRDAGVTILSLDNGRVVAPQGQSLAGTSLGVADEANRVLLAIDELVKALGDQTGQLSEEVTSRGGKLEGRQPDVHAEVEAGVLQIRERHTGVVIPWINLRK
ncbi:hypothetical protein IWX65_002662 [Arthrobacter sp. CAN_A214]